MKYTKENLTLLVKESSTISEVLRKLGKGNSGGAHQYLSKSIRRLNIDTSHFTGQSWSKGKKIGTVFPIEDYLSNKRRINSPALKKRLISDGLKLDECEICHLSYWYGTKLSLDLHHVDCNHDNNNLINLKILCPNCHVTLHKQLREAERSKKLATILVERNIRRSKSRLDKRKCIRPPYGVLISEIATNGYCATGRKYGVSDNAIRKWVKMYEKYI
jgi:hypothetical protein